MSNVKLLVFLKNELLTMLSSINYTGTMVACATTRKDSFTRGPFLFSKNNELFHRASKYPLTVIHSVI